MAGTKRTVELPGFFDLQVNGFAGRRLRRPGAHARARAAGRRGDREDRRHPVPARRSSPRRSRRSPRARGRSRGRPHPAIAGIHMEGPYISPEDGPRGAHARAFVRGADVDDFRRRQDAAEGRIRLVTVAPEAPGVLPLIEHVVGERRPRGDRAHGRDRRRRSRTRRAPAPRSRRTSATAARRCCPATRT